MDRIAVLTSGGDAPGMNAAIRAVVRTGLDRGWEVHGVHGGFAGLIAGRFEPLSARSVSGIVGQGGTMLGSTRCPEFLEEHGRRSSLEQLGEHGIDGLVVIGGNGSQAGAHALSRAGAVVVGIASTIDNDLVGSDLSIGVDTAVSVALEAIDRLKVTAASHQRAFLVEVMGRDSGHLALLAGVAGGAEAVLLPEAETDPEQLAIELRAAYGRGKAHAIVVVAEGARTSADDLARYFETHRQRLGFELRVTRLGHVQRGGSPTASDRLLATRLGAVAVESLARGRHGVLIGLRAGQAVATPLATVVSRRKALDSDLLRLAAVLAM
jgi:6-phosphofructokinase 1